MHVLPAVTWVHTPPDRMNQASVFLCRRVDALFRGFLERGFKTPGNPGSPVEEGPVDQTWGMREVYIRDPDGNALRFGTPP